MDLATTLVTMSIIRDTIRIIKVDSTTRVSSNKFLIKEEDNLIIVRETLNRRKKIKL